jgi:hypothetical protein
LDIRPVDVNELVAVVMGCAIPLVAVTGVMVRVALKPLVEALAKLRATDLQRLEDRVAFLERRLELAPPNVVRPALEPTASDPVPRLRD